MKPCGGCEGITPVLSVDSAWSRGDEDNSLNVPLSGVVWCWGAFEYDGVRGAA